MSGPLVTILIPTYARAAWLREAIASALAQTYSPLQVLVLDDASPDGTPEVAAAFAHDPRFRYQRNERNLGLAGNWRQGLSLVEGGFFCLLHDDDAYAPDFVARLVEPLQRDPTLVLAFGEEEVVDAAGAERADWTASHRARFGRDALAAGRVADFARVALVQQAVPAGAALFRRDRVGPEMLDERAGPASDMWLLQACVRSGGGAWYEPAALMRYRSHAGGLSSSARPEMYAGHRFRLREAVGDPAFSAIHGELREQLGRALAVSGIDAAAAGEPDLAAGYFAESLELSPSWLARLGRHAPRLVGALARTHRLARRARGVAPVVREVAGTVGRYSIAQVLTAAVSAVAGILIVRLLPVHEFALYALAASWVTVLVVVTDFGGTAALMYFARECRLKGEEEAPFVAAVRDARTRLFTVAYPLLGLGLLLNAHLAGFASGPILLSLAGVGAMVWWQQASTVTLMTARIQGRLRLSYAAELAGGAVRVGLVLALAFLGQLWSWSALLAGAVASFVVWLLTAHLVPRAAASPEHRRRVWAFLRPTGAPTIHYAFQDQVVFWAAGVIGSTRALAELGAVQRLTLPMLVWARTFGVTLVPRLSSVHDEREYRRRYLGCLLVLGGGAAAMVVTVAALARPLVGILGPKYAGVEGPLVLAVLAAAVQVVGDFCQSINEVRSWNRWQLAAVAALVALQAVLFVAWMPSTTAALVGFMLAVAAVRAALQFGFNLLGFWREELVRSRA